MPYSSPKFNERKATQMAARFLAAAGKKMPYMSVLKLMYFVDREALKRWGTPVTNDSYFALDHGPILSNVYDLMVEDHERRGFWATHISSPTDYRIELIDEAGNDQLSKAEERLIDEVFAKNGRLDQWELRKKSHDFPEWKDPHGSRLKIEIEDILTATGTDPNEAEKRARELNGLRKMQALSID